MACEAGHDRAARRGKARPGGDLGVRTPCRWSIELAECAIGPRDLWVSASCTVHVVACPRHKHGGRKAKRRQEAVDSDGDYS